MDRFKNHPRLLCLLTGMLSALGFAPLNLWWLTLLGLAAYAWLTFEADDWREVWTRGWLFGLGHFTVGNNWIAHAFTYQDAMPHWFGYGAVIGLAVFLAIYPAIGAVIAWFAGRGHPIGYAVAIAGGWTISEWLRSFVFTGFAWNPLGVVTLSIDHFAQGGQWIGTYGLSALMMFGGACLWLLIAGWRAVPLAVVAVGGLVAVIDFIDPPAKPAPRADMPNLVVVQPNIGQQTKHKKNFDAENFAKLASLSGKPGEGRRLILWPEAAIPDYLEDEPLARARLASLLGPNDVLLTGGVGINYDNYGVALSGRNSFYALDAKGRLTGRYDKAHLVPFGEYLPMRNILEPIGFARLVPGALDFIPGPGPVTIDIPGVGRVGGQICYEIIFSGHVVERDKRPAFVFNPSNDAWFGGWGPPQHLAQARMRAIEEAMPIVRSTPTGISAVIDGHGQIWASVPQGKADQIISKLPTAGEPGFFARHGNTVPLAVAALFLLLGVAISRPDRYGARI